MNGTISMVGNFSKNAFSQNTLGVAVPKLPDMGISGAANALSTIGSYIKAPTTDTEVNYRPAVQQWPVCTP